jgi:hypothetical protein
VMRTPQIAMSLTAPFSMVVGIGPPIGKLCLAILLLRIRQNRRSCCDEESQDRNRVSNVPYYSSSVGISSIVIIITNGERFVCDTPHCTVCSVSLPLSQQCIVNDVFLVGKQLALYSSPKA